MGPGEEGQLVGETEASGGRVRDGEVSGPHLAEELLALTSLGPGVAEAGRLGRLRVARWGIGLSGCGACSSEGVGSGGPSSTPGLLGEGEESSLLRP